MPQNHLISESPNFQDFIVNFKYSRDKSHQNCVKATWWCAQSDHTIYCYVNEKLRKITMISSIKFCSPGSKNGLYSRANKICSPKPPPIRFREIKNWKQIANGSHICLHLRLRARSGVWKKLFATILNSFCSHNNRSLVSAPVKWRSPLTVNLLIEIIDLIF